MKNCLIVTNNRKVNSAYSDRMQVLYLEEDYLAVLLKVRDLIHSGCKLLTHPMSGSLKPNQTPFKSVMLIKEGGEAITGEGFDDLMMIENSLDAHQKFCRGRPTPLWTEKIKNDFATIDLSIIDSAVNNPSLSRS